LPDPTLLSANKLEEYATVKMSPAVLLSASDTAALALPSYTLFDAEMVTVNGFAVMFAVVVADVFWL
jgi:hypothetical protein